MKRKITIERLESNPHDKAILYVFKIDANENEYFKFCDKFENGKTAKIRWAYDLIDRRMETICRDGVELEHFRPEGDGDSIKALPIDTGSILRLYCYRIDEGILILGNGGLKPRNKKDKLKNKTQDFPELNKYCETVKKIGEYIEARIQSGEFGREGNELVLDEFTLEIEI